MARLLSVSALCSIVAAQNRPFPLHLLPQATADLFGAKCQDGTPPGFYWKPAVTDAGKSRWKLHFRGGAWCYDTASCTGRLTNELGSSKYFAADPYSGTPSVEAVFGVMDDNATNPWGDANAVWLPYCDGSSWMGDAEEAVDGIWYRGFRNLQAVLHELDVVGAAAGVGGFLTSAKEVVVTGTSAGGLATVLHSSYIKSQLQQPNARLVAVPDAGFWWDAVTVAGTHAFAAGFKVAAAEGGIWNATARALSPRCLATFPPADAWKCSLTGFAYGTALADVDVFVMQSLYDSAQLGMELQLGCDPMTTCTAAQLVTMQQYRTTFQTLIETAQASRPRDGHFFTACYQHEESCRDSDWYGISVPINNGSATATPNSTFTAWYSGSADAPGRVVDGLWPDNKSCQPSIKHGSC